MRRARHPPHPGRETIGEAPSRQPVLVVGNTAGDGRGRVLQAMLDAGVPVVLSMVHWGDMARRELQAIDNGRHVFAVVLIERGMTVDETESLVRWASKRPRMQLIPMIVFTSFEMPGEEKRLRDAGAADYWVERYQNGPEAFAQMMRRLHYYMPPKSSSMT